MPPTLADVDTALLLNLDGSTLIDWHAGELPLPRHLHAFSCAGCALGGALSRNVTRSLPTSLRELRLESSGVEEIAPDALGALSHLEILCLGGNAINCCGHEWLRDSSALSAAMDACGVGGWPTCAFPPAAMGRSLRSTRNRLCTEPCSAHRDCPDGLFWYGVPRARHHPRYGR